MQRSKLSVTHHPWPPPPFRQEQPDLSFTDDQENKPVGLAGGLMLLGSPHPVENWPGGRKAASAYATSPAELAASHSHSGRDPVKSKGSQKSYQKIPPTFHLSGFICKHGSRFPSFPRQPRRELEGIRGSNAHRGPRPAPLGPDRMAKCLQPMA